MNDEPPQAGQIADLLLPLDGPYTPDRIIETARTIGELVRRLNHATFSRSALRYPPQLYRTVTALHNGVYGLKQTLTQLAASLDAFATDPRVEHDDRGDASAAFTDAALQLRAAVAGIGAVTTPLDAAAQLTSHLGYTTTPRLEQHAGPTPPPAPVQQPRKPRTR